MTILSVKNNNCEHHSKKSGKLNIIDISYMEQIRVSELKSNRKIKHKIKQLSKKVVNN
jgi:hypothetical protein